MLHLIGCGGIAASGKSTLFRKVMSETGGGLYWWQQKEGLLVFHSNDEIKACILGDYSQAAGNFAGTDKLSMAVQKDALAFLKRHKADETYHTVLFEGDRLWNGSFFAAVAELELEMTLIELTAKEEILHARHVGRKDTQKETWLAGRRTKLANVRKAYPVELWPNATEKDLKKNCAALTEMIKAGAEDE